MDDAELPRNNNIHQIRNYSKRGGVSIYLHNSLQYKVKDDLSINYENVESLPVGILFDQKKNILFNALYRPFEKLKFLLKQKTTS